MKIRNLRIRDFNQFKDIYLDLTYPVGHKKQGQPLEKVCFIGQSGTGKTSILKYLFGIFENKFETNYPGRFTLEVGRGNTIYTLSKSGPSPLYGRQHVLNQPPRNDNSIARALVDSIYRDDDLLSIFLPADFLSNKMPDTATSTASSALKIYDFSQINITAIWHRLLDEIKNHQDEVKKIRTQIEDLNRFSNLKGDEMKRKTIPLYDKLDKLESTEFNPLKKLANECLDIVLDHFNLKVNTDFNSDDELNRAQFIKVENKKGQIIPNGVLSSGTSQFILSSLPFYLLKPNNTVILFDEPERSLYPNIQKLLVEHYAKFARNSQFIYATHSPIIASCFDPWEVIELKFNSEGFVYQEKYFDGERHVDNYKIHPKYLTYELILQDVFEVKDTEGESRARKLTELIMLENQLKEFKAKSDNSSDDFKKTMEDYLNLGKLLSWPTTAIS